METSNSILDYNASMYPCDYCGHDVDWGQQALCCDCCDIWYYKTCISMTSTEFGYLDNNSKSFLCFKCHHISVVASRYHGYEVETSNRFSVLAPMDESVFVSPGAPPKHRSSLIGTTKSPRPASIHLSATSSTQSHSSASSATASSHSTATTRDNSTPSVNTLPH